MLFLAVLHNTTCKVLRAYVHACLTCILEGIYAINRMSAWWLYFELCLIGAVVVYARVWECVVHAAVVVRK